MLIHSTSGENHLKLYILHNFYDQIIIQVILLKALLILKNLYYDVNFLLFFLNNSF